MDIATIIGLVFAGVAVLGGFMAEGGHLASIMQPTAALIVLGGTVAAVFVQFPLGMILHALKSVKEVFLPKKVELLGLVKQLVDYAQKARREGVVSLEGDAEAATDPFLKKALSLAVDGSEARVVREAMEVEVEVLEEEGLAGPKVFEAMGGYAPTLGILGAVLGLIHVMQNLSDPSKLGAGIAVAFVATVYGVASANLIFLPFSSKLKVRSQEQLMRCNLIIAGVSAIVEGENPRLIEEKLKGYCGAEVQKAKGGNVVEMSKAA